MKLLCRILLRAGAAFALLLGLLCCAVLLVLHTNTGTRWALARLQPVLADSGVSLTWRRLDGTLFSGLQLAQFELLTAGASRNSLRADLLEFTWQPLLLINGRLVIDKLRIDALVYGYDGDPAAADDPLTEAELQNMLFTLPFGIELQQLDSSAVSLRFGETLIAFDVLSGSALLDKQRLRLANLDWQQGSTRLGGSAELDATLALNGTVSWELEAAGQRYAGMLEAGGSLRELQTQHRLDAPLLVTSEGRVVPGLFADPLQLDLRHRFTALDLAAFGQPDLLLSAGDVETRGPLDALAISGTLDVVPPGFEPLALVFVLEYRGDSLLIDSLTAAGTQLAVAADGTLALEPLALQLQWRLDLLDPGASLPALQLENINGAGSVALRYSDDSLDAELNLERLAGQLNDYPLLLSGNLNLVDSQLAALDLELDTSNNLLQLSGSTSPALDLRWNLRAAALDQLWQGLSGQVAGTGTINGSLEQPEVNGDLEGSALALRTETATLRLAGFELQAEYGSNGNNLGLQLRELTQQATVARAEAQVLLHEAELNLVGTPQQHRLQASVNAPEVRPALALEGRLESEDWHAVLQSAEALSNWGDWSLESPARLDSVGGAFTAAEQCWRYQVTALCLQGGRDGSGGIDASVALSEVPLSWLNPPGADSGVASDQPTGLQMLLESFGAVLPDSVRVDGSVDLNATLRNFRAGEWDSLEAELLPRGVGVQITQQLESDLVSLAPLVQRLVFSDEIFRVTSRSGDWAADLGFQVLRMGENGTVPQGGLRASLLMDRDSRLDGSVNFAFSDLSWLESLVPQLREPSGMLNGVVAIGGTRSEPALNSQLRLENGSFEVPQYGLAIEEFNLALQSASIDALEVQGSARSGEGRLVLDATILAPLQQTRSVRARLSGTDFLIFDMDYGNGTLSPDLQLNYDDGALDLRGKLMVPMMRLDLFELLGTVGNSAVPVSRDVVIVRESDGSVPGSGQLNGEIPLSLNLALVLGDSVSVQGYGLDASINGELQLEQMPGRALLVYGELGIPEGRYTIYNQELSTRNGRVMFFGSAANPVVDIRAFRETPSAEVGMLLSGPVKSMQGQLYSTPALPDREVLAMLVTGKSFGNVGAEDSDALLSAVANFGFERSEGLTSAISSKLGLDSVTVGGGGTYRDSALGIGKYITPDLLMSYKVGLFDRQAVLSINYSLTERLRLQVETGISQSVDISYTLEKD